MHSFAVFTFVALFFAHFSFAAPIPGHGSSNLASHVKQLWGRKDNWDRRVAAQRMDRRASGYGDGGSHFVYYSDNWVDNGAPPDPSQIPGWNVFNLGFYLSTAGPQDMAQAWQELPASQRSSIKSAYEAAGVSLLVSAFGGTDAPITYGVDASDMAHEIAHFVSQYNLDGVDVDFEDFNAMGAGTAEAWLIEFTQTLRSSLPSGAIISHAPIAPWFTDDSGTLPGGGYLKVFQEAGSDIDFFNLQFYNQGTAYTDCTSLLTKSDLGGYEHTSIFEIHANGVPLDMLVLGKPGDNPDDEDSGGHMPESELAQCVAQAKAKGWDAGLMIWEYPDVPEDFITQVWGS